MSLQSVSSIFHFSAMFVDSRRILLLTENIDKFIYTLRFVLIGVYIVLSAYMLLLVVQEFSSSLRTIVAVSDKAFCDRS